MNSFQELNNYGGEYITFTTQQDYTFDWGNFLGNATIISNVSVSHQLQNRQIINTFEFPVRPINVLVTSAIDSEGIALVDVSYNGPNGNIVLDHPSDSQWVAGNIWSIADYNEFFANTQVSVDGLRSLDFDYTTTVTDQVGNTRTFQTSVDVVPFGFSRPTQVTYNEDSNATVSGMAITAITNFQYEMKFDLVPYTAGNLKFPATSDVGNSITLTNTRDQLNIILADNLIYIPSDDYANNANIQVSITNLTTGNLIGNSNIQLAIGQTHSEFTYPVALGRSKSANTPVGTDNGSANLQITDLAQNRQYTSTLTMPSATIGNLYIGNTNYGNAITLTGNITQVNANLANIVLVSNVDSNTNSSITYTQTQTTANILQGQVNIPVTYQPSSVHIASGVEKPVGNKIANSSPYTQNLSSANDFWAYISTTQNQTTNGRIYEQFLAPSTANSDPALLRTFTTVKYSPSAIEFKKDDATIKNYGIVGRFDNLGQPSITYSAGYFGFWIRFKSLADQAIACLHEVDSWPRLGYYDILNLHLWNGKLRWTNQNPALIYGSSLSGSYIDMITPQINTWYHVAIQRTNNAVPTWSCWVDGIPQTKFIYADSTRAYSVTGSNWQEPTSTLNLPRRFSKFTFGAPLMPMRKGDNIGFNFNYNQSRLDAIIDDIVVTNSTLYTNLEPFTPVPMTYSGNVRQLWTGI